MKWVLQQLILVGILTAFSAAQEETTGNALKQASKSASSTSLSHQVHYLDARERKSATLKFTWRLVRNSIYEKKRLQRETSDSQAESLQLSEGIVELDAEQVLIPDLQGTYTIQRTPQLTVMRVQEELPKIGENTVGKSERPIWWDYYYLGGLGEIVISVFRGFLGDANIGGVHIGYAERCGGFGLPSPLLGPHSPGEMIFLGGVSPFRMLGAEPSDWKLVEVNEAEWVFELKIEETRRDHFKGLLPSGEQARFHLSRKHGDAPLRLEFRSERGYKKWETLAFTQVQGIWMPQAVSCETSWGGTTNQYLYELQSASQTATVEIDIPLRAPVRDWRALGLDLWRSRDEEKSIVVEWSPELLSSLWKTIRQEQRD